MLKRLDTKALKKPPEAREFQSPAAALMDDKPPAVSLVVLFALTGVVAAAVAFASLASVDEIVVAPGQLITTVPTLVVQPLETVSVKSVDVKVGDIVHKGEVLASLDPTFADADVQQLQSKLASYSAREARLQAELAGQDYTLPASPTPSESLEAALFADRELQYASQMKSYDQDIARYTAALQSARDELQKVQESEALIEKIIAMHTQLVDQALVSKLQLIDAQNQLVSAQRSMVQITGKIDDNNHQLASTIAQRDAFAQEWRAKVADELVSVRRDREAAAEDLDKALRRRQMVSLTAPRDAIVLSVAQRSAGSVLQQAEPLFTLVPLDAPLEADVRISPRDVGRVHDGEEVRIKLDAFPFQSHGTVQGEIKTISADAIEPPARSQQDVTTNNNAASPYYDARVTLVDTHLSNMSKDARLLPGMTATAEIKVGQRRVISYLLYPILKGLDESLREP